MDILSFDLLRIRDAISKREISASQIVTKSLEKIKTLNPKLNCFLSINEKAVERATSIDKEIAAGKHMGPLAGIPLAIKDNYCTKGLRTTAGSKILENFVPPYSATVIQKLESAGAICIGKTNLDEFAMGSSNENSAFGNVKNPWNLNYVPGGSSGGSAVAVASGIVPGATGTDTGGSIRLPAHYCGIAGIKPTYGRISRYGLVAFASSLDQAGPMAKTVKDCAELLEVMSGHDPKDSTSSDLPVPEWSDNIKTNLGGITVGLPEEYFAQGGMDEDTRKVMNACIEMLKAKGAKFVDVKLPLTEACIATYYIICTCEASSNLSRYDGVRFGLRVKGHDLEDMYLKSRGAGFGVEAKRRIMIGTYALSSGYYDAYYIKACKVRRLIQRDFLTAFSKCDLILSPVSTSAAFKLGDRNLDPLKMYFNDIYTTSVNLAGLPGMSVPAGFSSAGMPIGVQLVAPHWEEQRIFNAAQAIEESCQAKERRPHVTS